MRWLSNSQFSFEGSSGLNPRSDGLLCHRNILLEAPGIWFHRFPPVPPVPPVPPTQKKRDRRVLARQVPPPDGLMGRWKVCQIGMVSAIGLNFCCWFCFCGLGSCACSLAQRISHGFPIKAPNVGGFSWISSYQGTLRLSEPPMFLPATAQSWQLT